jgi:hypothetical protein
MINIHHQLETYSQSTFIRERTKRSAASQRQSGDRKSSVSDAGLFFRYRCSHPGAALYSTYDDVRLLLQVINTILCLKMLANSLL